MDVEHTFVPAARAARVVDGASEEGGRLVDFNAKLRLESREAS